MSAFNDIYQLQKGYQLSQISIYDLLTINQAPGIIYAFSENQFIPVLPKHIYINKNTIRKLLHKGYYHFFIDQTDYKAIQETQIEALQKLNRSLSMGDPKENLKKQSTILTRLQNHLYNDPSNDEILNTQVQSLKNLSSFLSKNLKYTKYLYNIQNSSQEHYKITQPFLSSFLLLSFLKNCSQFNDKEIENLFLVSIFKDIGMSIVPNEIIDKSQLTIKEKVKLKNHSEQSVNILSGRISLGQHHLEIIKNHHTFSNFSVVSEENNQAITGFETMIVNVFDIITAMTNNRPFRASKSMFETLNLVKKLINDQYPSEYSYLVKFIARYFKMK